MADEHTTSLTLRLSPTTKALVATACRERQVTATDLVEAALVAFLSAAENSVQQRLVTIEQALGAIVGLLEAQVKATASPAPIATYEQMYGPIEPVVSVVAPVPEVSLPAEAPATRGRLRRWLMKETG